MKIKFYFLLMLILANSSSLIGADAPKDEKAGYKYRLNVYLSETEPNGKGVACFIEDTGPEIICKNATEINKYLNDLNLAGQLRFKKGSKRYGDYSVLCIYNIDKNLSEHALKEAMIMHQEPCSLIFFRAEPEGVQQEERATFVSNKLVELNAPKPSSQSVPQLLPNNRAFIQLTYSSLNDAFLCRSQILESGVTYCSQPILLEVEIRFPNNTLVIADDTFMEAGICYWGEEYRIVIDSYSEDKREQNKMLIERLFQSQRNIKLVIATPNGLADEEVIQDLIIFGSPKLKDLEASLRMHYPDSTFTFGDQNLDQDCFTDEILFEEIRVNRRQE